ncbi:hypothetical protein GX586_04010 [bacterium]|nr:hypothetical protein [bacterium]
MRTVSLLSAFAASAALSVLAVEKCAPVNPPYVLARGFANMMTGWLEVPRGIIYENSRIPLIGFIAGPVKGSFLAIWREGAGIIDVICMGLTREGLYSPLVPDFIWDADWICVRHEDIVSVGNVDPGAGTNPVKGRPALPCRPAAPCAQPQPAQPCAPAEPAPSAPARSSAGPSTQAEWHAASSTAVETNVIPVTIVKRRETDASDAAAESAGDSSCQSAPPAPAGRLAAAAPAGPFALGPDDGEAEMRSLDAKYQALRAYVDQKRGSISAFETK